MKSMMPLLIGAAVWKRAWRNKTNKEKFFWSLIKDGLHLNCYLNTHSLMIL